MPLGFRVWLRFRDGENGVEFYDFSGGRNSDSVDCENEESENLNEEDETDGLTRKLIPCGAEVIIFRENISKKDLARSYILAEANRQGNMNSAKRHPLLAQDRGCTEQRRTWKQGN